MRSGQASRTAEHNALFRALETRRPSGERPAVDPYAACFLSPPFRAVDGLARTRAGHRLTVACIDRGWPGVRTSVVARTRLIDDLVTDGVGRMGQVVLLGAGFDSRAHRLDQLRGPVVFEVDHPATQARKRDLLASTSGTNDAVRYVPVDFLHDDLGAALGDADFDPGRPTLVVWEGVTNYLSEPAVDETIRWCAGVAGGSELVFTYVDRQVLVDPAAFHRADRVLATSRRVGEALTFGLDPAEAAAWLDERGLVLVSDLGAADYRRSYYGERARTIRGHEFYRVAHARIAGRPAG
jgi:methyltransferase (TIGR00027 family)